MTTQVSTIPVSVDYTSRDFYSIREQLIKRIQARIPSWTATDPADFGVAFVEAMAYTTILTVMQMKTPSILQHKEIAY